jgi:prolipoprotein diacylglyceryl transferase
MDMSLFAIVFQNPLLAVPFGWGGEGLFVTWNPDIVAFSLGAFAVRWYSLFWCLGLLGVYLLMHRLFRQQKLGEEQFEPMFMYCFLGILIGARLGHCLFYEPGYYLSHPTEMLLPIRNVPGEGWTFTGYEGLASHGGTLGLMIALWLYAKRVKLNIMRVLDNVAIVTPICACAIRLGNLMNSEIIGRPTDVPWAFIFERVDMLPRHPGQLYEAICYAIFFFVGWFFYRHKPQRVGTGFFFGLCLFMIFLSRIFVEYTKENQEAFEEGMLLNMGQLLSIPFVLLGLYCMLGGKLCRALGEKK